jgi:hypothetical protein
MRRRFIVERLHKPPAGAARSIKSVWFKVGTFGKIAPAERCLINSLIDHGKYSRSRIREVRAAQ